MKTTLSAAVIGSLEVMRKIILEADAQEKVLRKQLEAAAPKLLPKATGALTWVLLMRESGLDTPIDDETREKLAEVQYLERSIGRTGRVAIRPVLPMTSKDLWQIYMLGQ